jgi:hypothetical protein
MDVMIVIGCHDYQSCAASVCTVACGLYDID